MCRPNRCEIVIEGEIQVFHCQNRCVRRTFLCGFDAQSQRDYSHRKDWVRDRLEVLAGIFSMDVLSYSVMSNHLHVVLRTRPDILSGWSDEEVARRWWNLYPKRRQKDGSAAEPTDAELEGLLKNTSALKKQRKRLANLSWFMKCLAEPIARRSNREDGVTGHFWEGRFKAQPLLDEMAIAACMAYVDLNPVRAGLALTPEHSEFTSIRDRIDDRRNSLEFSSLEKRLEVLEHGVRAGWLAPIELDPQDSDVRGLHSTRRASSKGCLPMSLEQYLVLVDWTGRQLRADKVGSIPQDCAGILDRLDFSAETWIDIVTNFRRRFRVEAGLAEAVAAFRVQRRTRRLQVLA